MDNKQILVLFQKVVAESVFDELCRQHKLRFHRGIYTLPTVVWLMVYQRLHAKGTLAAAVHLMAQAGTGWLGKPSSKRVREARISSNTGGYCQARQKLPTLVATQVTDHIFAQIRSLMDQSPVGPRLPVFVIDGSTLRLQHEPELIDSFPPGSNQHGDNHWPVLRLVVLHDVYSGLATRPSWGPMYGEKAVSEQELAEQALDRLPVNAVVMGDGNFGIFAFAHAVQKSKRLMLVRLTNARAQKILQNPVLAKGTCRKVTWTASQWDRNAHPNLTGHAAVEGRVLVFENPSRPGEKLCLFTTLELEPQQILDLYKLRWNIETDLRSLKRTVDLQHIRSKSLPMVQKEILLAVSAYNFVRAVMFLAAQRANVVPRKLSFSLVQDAVMAALPFLDASTTDAEYTQRLERLLQTAAQAKLPERSRYREFPREVWGQGKHFPPRTRETKLQKQEQDR